MSPYTLIASLAVVALGAGPQVATPKAEPASSIERALIERSCGTPYTPWADEDAQLCFSDHLLTLRTDFGRDLSKLSAADRKAMDVACRDLRRPERPELQDAYVDCLSGQLLAIRDRQQRQAGVARDPLVDAAMVPALSDAEEVPTAPTSPWRRPAIVGVILTSVIAMAGLGFLAMRPRRTRRTCRVCGVDAPGADLYAACRHEAAEAVKRQAAERAQHASIQQEESRQECVAETEQGDVSGPSDVGLLIAPAEEDHGNEPVAGRADNRLEETVQKAEEAEPVFDPYARKRYDPEQVSFLGYEAQEHFRAKAASVERAYQMLFST